MASRTSGCLGLGRARQGVQVQLADDAAGLGHKLFDVAEKIAPQSAPGISRSDVEVGTTKEGDGGRRKQREWSVHQLQQAGGHRAGLGGTLLTMCRSTGASGIEVLLLPEMSRDERA